MSSTPANGEPKNEQDNAGDQTCVETDVIPVRRRFSVQASLAHHEHIQDAQSLASIDRPPEEQLPSQKIYHPLSFHVLALLAPASILGLLARLGLLALTTYDGQSIFPLVYVQSVGCLIMGLGIGLKEPIGRYYGPLYTAITTGFCGSLTTFSGWQLDVFTSWINPNNFHRDGLRDTIDGIAKTVFTLSISLASLSFGAHIASRMTPYLPALPCPSRVARYSLTVLSVLMYASTIVTYFFLPSTFRHEATASLMFSYPGTLTRYLLSLSLNPRATTIPLGTFTANILGTGLLGGFWVLQRSTAPVSITVCALLQGLGDGYCGCLTTVSTFTAEFAALKVWKAWVYIAVSWITAQLLLLAIIGPMFFGGHAERRVTCT